MESGVCTIFVFRKHCLKLYIYIYIYSTYTYKFIFFKIYVHIRVAMQKLEDWSQEFLEKCAKVLEIVCKAKG